MGFGLATVIFLWDTVGVLLPYLDLAKVERKEDHVERECQKKRKRKEAGRFSSKENQWVQKICLV